MDTTFISVGLCFQERYTASALVTARVILCLVFVRTCFPLKNDTVLIPSVWSSSGRFSGRILVAFFHHFFLLFTRKLNVFCRCYKQLTAALSSCSYYRALWIKSLGMRDSVTS
jgi:hypothetical protein